MTDLLKARAALLSLTASAVRAAEAMAAEPAVTEQADANLYLVAVHLDEYRQARGGSTDSVDELADQVRTTIRLAATFASRESVTGADAALDELVARVRGISMGGPR